MHVVIVKGQPVTPTNLLFSIFGAKTPAALVHESGHGNLDRVAMILDRLYPPIRVRVDAAQAAARARHVEIVDFILCHHEQEGFVLAAEIGDVELVEILLRRAIPVDKKVIVESSKDDHAEETGLGAAITGGHLTIVRLLLHEGADPNLWRYQGTGGERTPLRSAVGSGDVEIVRLLIKHGARPDGDGDGRPLRLAAARGDCVMMGVLLEAGAGIHCCNAKHGTQALHEAVESGQLAAVRFLLERGADVNAPARDWKGAERTPLKIARQETESLEHMKRLHPAFKGRYPGVEMMAILATNGGKE